MCDQLMIVKRLRERIVINIIPKICIAFVVCVFFFGQALMIKVAKSDLFNAYCVIDIDCVCSRFSFKMRLARVFIAFYVCRCSMVIYFS